MAAILDFFVYKQSQMARAQNYLKLEMGLGMKGHRENIPISFSREEYTQYAARFRSLDTDNKGYITVNDLRNYFKVSVQYSITC